MRRISYSNVRLKVADCSCTYLASGWQISGPRRERMWIVEGTQGLERGSSTCRPGTNEVVGRIASGCS